MRTTHDAIRAASAVTGIPMSVITGPSRATKLLSVRVAIALWGRRNKKTWHQMGRAMNRDHTTVLHYVMIHGRSANALRILEGIDQYLEENRPWHERIRLEDAHA